MAGPALEEFKAYCEKHITPRLEQIHKEERQRFIVPMMHESELDQGGNDGGTD